MESNEFEPPEKMNPNTEYLPTKCRITKPPPPKPAANPLQFVKVSPCPLFQKAHEQIRKVEEIKKERKEVREEAEDWQQNLDNWKSCRRKRQEHIIERVVEVKKMEQEEHDRHRRRNKTFSEMMEDRSKGRHKFNIPIFDDDSNDLSDYGIGSSSSKTNSIKDVDTDDSCSLLDEKETSFESQYNKENSSASNQSQSEDETRTKRTKHTEYTGPGTNETKTESTEQYTYEKAIQGYRSRIRTNIDESIFNKNQDFNKSKEYSEAQAALPKGEIFKRKYLFETERPLEINNYESPTSRRLSEDFANSQSIKQRLRSLEKFTDQALIIEKNEVKERLQNVNKQYNDNANNNKTRQNKITSYITERHQNHNLDSKNNNKNERCSSPETELNVDNFKSFSRDLDTLMCNKDFSNNYPPSVSSTELMGMSSDREDSGIHTADVSCSVSQADESVDDPELSTTLTNLEKFSIDETIPENYVSSAELEICDKSGTESGTLNSQVLEYTLDLLESLKRDSSENLHAEKTVPMTPKVEPKIYENIEFGKDPIVDFIVDENFALAPATIIEPPKVKPPPPPPPDSDEVIPEMKRVNSTKRIKREIHMKRYSFLGLDEPTDEQIYPEITIDKPPDINTFLQKESKLEKSLYKKSQDDGRMGILSKVESHDSGLDIDRGRLSSDTWCSSIGESSTPSPERHDREQANSISSEEDEIMKKEREIIEMVEKEEKSRDVVEYFTPSESSHQINQINNMHEPYLGSETFNNPYFGKNTGNYLDDQDSEVLKVEQELRQLEREELKRQRETLLFQESRAKARLENNRHSSENLFEDVYCPYQENVNHRKSMPELQHIPLEYRKSMVDVSNSSYYRPAPELDMQYRKSMPDIQHAYHKSMPEYQIHPELDHRKSMPDIQKSVFKSPTPGKRQPIMPGKPIRPMTKEQRDRYLMLNPSVQESLHSNGKTRQLSRHSLQALSAVPKNRQLAMDNWIQPRQHTEKNNKQHWLIQEAELRRISEQKTVNTNRNWQQQRQEKHLPDSIIQTLTQRAQTRTEMNERNQTLKSPTKESIIQHQYANHNPTMGHALPMSSYPPPSIPMEESQDRILSVSGKEKCSNCNKELGRGAAMIIESLCLCYHMECFICCVCHMQLGDGRMGTDVRVRNQKLHCHNCYSSDDGIKFSCV